MEKNNDSRISSTIRYYASCYQCKHNQGKFKSKTLEESEKKIKKHTNETGHKKFSKYGAYNNENRYGLSLDKAVLR